MGREVNQAKKTEARKFREDGLFLPQIAEQLEVAISTVHKWTRDIKIPYDLTGQTFGSWKVLYKKNCDSSGTLYTCVCTKCTKQKDVYAGNLRRKKSLSCGCERQQKPLGIAPLNYVYRYYKQGAKRRKLDFFLTKDEFERLILSSCHYCGSPPSMEFKQWAYRALYKYNGIDRIDSSVGYNLKNSVSCCKKCNVSKSILSYENFLKKLETLSGVSS